jgi:hypothetical protein
MGEVERRNMAAFAVRAENAPPFPAISRHFPPLPAIREPRPLVWNASPRHRGEAPVTALRRHRDGSVEWLAEPRARRLIHNLQNM